MTDDDRHFVELVLKKRTFDAQESVGREVARDKARRAKNRVLDDSRRWIGVSDILANHANIYIAGASADVLAISASSDAFAVLSEAVNEFLSFLDDIFEKDYRDWYRHSRGTRADTTSLPKHWSKARTGLGLDLEIKRRLFDRPVNAKAPCSSGENPATPDQNLQDIEADAN